MIKTRSPAARPPNQPRVPPEVFNVALAALLAPVLSPVQTRLLPYLRAQVIVTAKASGAVDPPASRVAFAAIRIAIDVCVVTGELSRRQKLGPRGARHQRSGNPSRYHRAAHDHQGGDPPPHSEKIQR